MKIHEDDFVVPTAVFLGEDFSKLRVFNGFPERYHNDSTLDTIDGTRNYLKGKFANDILEDVFKHILNKIRERLGRKWIH